MIKRKLIVFIATGFLVLSTFAFGAQAPDVMLKNVSTSMLNILNKHQGRIKNDIPFLERTVRKEVLPHFTVTTMARSVVGRQAWKSASLKQRNAFKREFTNMVIGVYAAPLADFDRDRIKFYSMSATSAKRSRVQVKSLIIRQTGQKIPVNYRLVKMGDAWKVYDFSIEGVSMVQSYRSQFANVIRQSGFSGLINKVQRHNRKA